MHKTRIAKTASTPRRLRGLAAATLTAPVLGALILAALPITAQAQSLNNNTIKLVNPVIAVQPTLPQINPIQTLKTPILHPALPGAVQIAPNINPAKNPTINSAINPAINPVAGATRIAPSVAATGLGRLVAPGAENASAVVARIGASTRADSSSLTADFDGDGLINFEIAPGIVDIPADSARAGGDALGGLIGQHVTMATGTADRVLDSVINLTGVTPATSFEVANGTVVLGGFRPQDRAGAIDLPVPDGPGSKDPTGTDSRDPDRLPGQRGDDPATGGPLEDNPRQTVEICLSHGCYRPGTIEPKPDDGPDLEHIFNFSGFRRPPVPDSIQDDGMDDLLNVSIMLPLRGREQEADQFSNYGNEEIW